MNLIYISTKLFSQLLIRNERRQFLDKSNWEWSELLPHELALTADNDSGSDIDNDIIVASTKIRSILTFIPQVIPFTQRVTILQEIIKRDKHHFYSTGGGGMEAFIGYGGTLKARIRRTNIFIDAFKALHKSKTKMKGRIQVEFVTEQGTEEAGIDGGGLFKEFMDEFCKTAFDPKFGLFIPTSHQYLTANPDSATAINSSDSNLHLQYYNFVGMMLGKSLYEGILVESEFAGGLLNILLGRSNQLDDLYYLDEQLYRSLMQLKHYANKGGDIDALELYFETNRNNNMTVDIIPNGSKIKVNKNNIHTYIHRLAYYKQNIETAEQCRALLSGFRLLIPIGIIRMFNTKELQLLIGGSQQRINIDDMKNNTSYGGGYHPSQPYIIELWKIIDDMSVEDQANLLRFVTSCSRQPLLGFSQLNPSFCIQKIPAYYSQYSGLEPPLEGEAPRLPSAATCMNLLKLPLYNNTEILKEKLLYAIRSNSGFELS